MTSKNYSRVARNHGEDDRKKALMYTRVSSKEQEREGYSIPAQKKYLKEYAARTGLEVVKEFEDIQSAKRTGRRDFKKLVQWARKHPDHVILTEKTDRLVRNLFDVATIEDLNVEIHYPKENVVVPRNACANDKFTTGINYLVAKRYVDNLREETIKGQDEKASQGIRPTKAPLGYLNVIEPGGRNGIAVDSEMAPFIVNLFKRYATGNYSIKEVSRMARADGLARKRTGGYIPPSSIRKILRNRFYSGSFDWRGKIYEGAYEAIVSVEVWERVQGVLDGRSKRKTHRVKHDFAYSNLMTCADCGSSIVAQRQKGKYIYYYCTGYKGRTEDEPFGTCRQKYVREEEVERQFLEKLRQLHFDVPTIDWVSNDILASHSEVRRVHKEAINRLRTLHDRLEERIDNTYVDKLDGRITQERYDRMTGQWTEEQSRCREEMEHHRKAEQSYMAVGGTFSEVGGRALALFKSLPPLKKRHLLNLAFVNCAWKEGRVTAEFREPFNSLARETHGELTARGANEE